MRNGFATFFSLLWKKLKNIFIYSFNYMHKLNSLHNPNLICGKNIFKKLNQIIWNEYELSLCTYRG